METLIHPYRIPQSLCQEHKQYVSQFLEEQIKQLPSQQPNQMDEESKSILCIVFIEYS